MCVPWELNPQPIALLTQCSTTEPQEHLYHEILRKKSELGDVNVQLREKKLNGWKRLPVMTQHIF